MPARKRWKGERTRMMWLSGRVDACARAKRSEKAEQGVPVPLPAPWPPLGACPARSAVFSITTTMFADSLRSPDRVVTASRNAI
jgi:hypothetical protein